MLITAEELSLHSVTIDKAYPVGYLDRRSGGFRQLSDLRLHALAELVGSDIRIRGHFGTRLQVECDRCGLPVELPLEESFDLYYRPMSSIAREEEVEIPANELEVGFYSGEGVEVSDLVKEQVILALPMKILCRLDCQGLCSVCGANLNLERCQCRPARNDSPFARLAGH
jgi:uncharacterized protein